MFPASKKWVYIVRGAKAGIPTKFMTTPNSLPMGCKFNKNEF